MSLLEKIVCLFWRRLYVHFIKCLMMCAWDRCYENSQSLVESLVEKIVYVSFGEDCMSLLEKIVCTLSLNVWWCVHGTGAVDTVSLFWRGLYGYVSFGEDCMYMSLLEKILYTCTSVMYMYISSFLRQAYTYMYIHMYKCTYSCTYVFIHIRRYIYIYIYMCVCIYIHVYTCTYTFLTLVQPEKKLICCGTL